MPNLGHLLTFLNLCHTDTWLVPVVITSVLCTPDDVCREHPKHIEWSHSK